MKWNGAVQSLPFPSAAFLICSVLQKSAQALQRSLLLFFVLSSKFERLCGAGWGPAVLVRFVAPSAAQVRAGVARPGADGRGEDAW